MIEAIERMRDTKVYGSQGRAIIPFKALDIELQNLMPERFQSAARSLADLV